MNKAKLKSYAPQARKDFIAAVTARAHLLGISSKAGKLEVAASQPHGDATVIAGQAWPVKVHSQRQQLIARIEKDGFDQTMEVAAYTWFNRFAALRYMELHGYLDHGFRALSSAEGILPEILTHAAELAHSGELPGLRAALVTEMKLSGNRDGELYRLLLVAQCNALSNVMPFLFERIDDETELLLPDNLLRTDSVIANMVDAIAEDDWKEIEIIGWLYQFYIAEEKERVDKKLKNGGAVESHEIPAKTQLFTPNWIVQYLVQNSLGRLWLLSNPASALKELWQYHIEPAAQSSDVQTQLDILIQNRKNEDGGSLNPESITLLDPACGSGHILVEAYDVFKVIYLERGYQLRAIPRLILEKNLYGLDIDDRAAQMACFALLMKARADDRRLFKDPITLNVISLQNSKGLDAEELFRALQSVEIQSQLQRAHVATIAGFINDDLFPSTHPQRNLGEITAPKLDAGFTQDEISKLIDNFIHAKTFGSLLELQPELHSRVVAMDENLRCTLKDGDLYAKAAAHDLLPLIQQAKILGMRFDAVVANPPYMGNNAMSEELKSYARTKFEHSRTDLFAMMMERAFLSAKSSGIISMVTMQSWMFLSSYESLRSHILQSKTISSMVHLGARAFTEISGEIVQTTAFSLLNSKILGHVPSFIDATIGNEVTKASAVRTPANVFDQAVQEDFDAVPGKPISYWASVGIRRAFKDLPALSGFAEPRKGMVTADNPRFVRTWFEVSMEKIGFDFPNRNVAKLSGLKWFPYHKGGEYRKWYGNLDWVVNWENDGHELFNMKGNGYKVGSTNQNVDQIFKSALLWTKITSKAESFRYSPPGFLFDDASGLCPVKDKSKEFEILGLLNSKIVGVALGALNQTLNLNPGDLAKVPCNADVKNSGLVAEAVALARSDWDSMERSWAFPGLPWLFVPLKRPNAADSWLEWSRQCAGRVQRLLHLETENNRLFINAYGLEHELSPEVLEDQITLSRANREKDCQRLISYIIGCMMGRYSLDMPGLVYAKAGNFGFDGSHYASFPADADGIVPLTDDFWFEDDAASRIREFLLAVWGANTLAENMTWLAESLGFKPGETPDETIRRYLADKFYKDHLQTYKKRPIYWLFSSGKQGAFQALVYLHRYNEGTLSRMRAEYVVPLSGKIQSRIDMLEKDAAAASSTASRNKLTKEVEKLKKKHVELLAYDEQLRHWADMRIKLDLDDGVKVNYGKFGDLLIDVKTVTGGASDD